jgi:MoxR-like ATPase
MLYEGRGFPMTDDKALGDVQTGVRQCGEACDRLRKELAKAVCGHEPFIEQVLIAILAGGHALVEGVAGLAKTLLMRSLARATRLPFRKITSTPDLVPGDLVVAECPEKNTGSVSRACGPLFASLVLVEEIERAPPKTQAMLTDAMDQRQVAFGDAVRELPSPFFLLATLNPLDREDTSPLRQTALERFLMHVRVDYPSREDEWQIARSAMAAQGSVEPVMAGAQILAFQKLVAGLPVHDRVLEYALALVRASRPNSQEAPAFIDRWVSWGAGPRGVVALVSCAKARAVLQGRFPADVSDVRAVAPAVLRHRIAANDVAQANALAPDSLVTMLLETVPPDSAAALPEGF